MVLTGGRRWEVDVENETYVLGLGNRTVEVTRCVYLDERKFQRNEVETEKKNNKIVPGFSG